MTTHTHQTAPTQFVEANGIRFACRRLADTITLASSYVVMLSQPDKVATFIIRAAQ